jgi:hypothetical protein
MPSEPKDLVAAFQQMHGEMLARVHEGTLPADVGAKANELKMALEKYLIKSQAQLQVLQLDVLYGAEDQRPAANANAPRWLTCNGCKLSIPPLCLERRQRVTGSSRTLR